MVRLSRFPLHGSWRTTCANFGGHLLSAELVRLVPLDRRHRETSSEMAMRCDAGSLNVIGARKMTVPSPRGYVHPRRKPAR